MSDTGLEVFTLVTPSHAELCHDWFQRTLPPDCRPVVETVAAPPVSFGLGQWHRVVAHKLDLVAQAIAQRGADDVIALSDVDVRFYRPFASDLHQRMRGLDLLFQNNRPSLPPSHENLCSGFVGIRCNRRALDFFQLARAVLEQADDPLVGDQRACIEVLRRQPESVRWALLPRGYWSPGDPRGRWQPGRSLSPPPGIVLHHANHTVGNANKLAQLRQVEQLVAAETCLG